MKPHFAPTWWTTGSRTDRDTIRISSWRDWTLAISRRKTFTRFVHIRSKALIPGRLRRPHVLRHWSSWWTRSFSWIGHFSKKIWFEGCWEIFISATWICPPSYNTAIMSIQASIFYPLRPFGISGSLCLSQLSDNFGALSRIHRDGISASGNETDAACADMKRVHDCNPF